MVIVLLNKWGIDGFLAHTRRVAAFYKQKRDMFEKIAHKHLDGLATWVSPEAGMFVSLSIPLRLCTMLRPRSHCDLRSHRSRTSTEATTERAPLRSCS